MESRPAGSGSSARRGLGRGVLQWVLSSQLCVPWHVYVLDSSMSFLGQVSPSHLQRLSPAATEGLHKCQHRVAADCAVCLGVLWASGPHSTPQTLVQPRCETPIEVHLKYPPGQGKACRVQTNEFISLVFPLAI